MAYNPQLYAPQPMTAPTAQTGWGYQPMQTFAGPSTAPQAGGIVGVNGIEGAKAYPMGANQSMVAFDNNQDVMFLMRTDGGGYKTIQEFEFFPRGSQSEEPQPDSVTRDDLEALAAKVDEIAESVKAALADGQKSTRTRKAANDG